MHYLTAARHRIINKQASGFHKQDRSIVKHVEEVWRALLGSTPGARELKKYVDGALRALDASDGNAQRVASSDIA